MNSHLNLYFQEFCTSTTISVPKVESIKKENKTIDDLLNWNREVSQLVNSLGNIEHLDIQCSEFKIFNPLNDKQIGDSTFSKIKSYSVGILEEDKFSRFISPNSILNARTL